MRIDILTIFPGMFAGPLTESIIKRACDNGILDIKIHDIRDFARDKHKIVDDYPFGGGAGMVMKPGPIFDALEAVVESSPAPGSTPPPVILMSPQGKRFDQETAKELAEEARLVFLCGHYEGIDERVREHLVCREISVGDYVLSGGELPCMVVIDAVARMIPGVLDEESRVAESFYNGLLDYPQYTRPQEFRGLKVPEVLVSGDHEKVRKWRRKESLRRTLMMRPDLLAQVSLTEEDLSFFLEMEDELTGIPEGLKCEKRAGMSNRSKRSRH